MSDFVDDMHFVSLLGEDRIKMNAITHNQHRNELLAEYVSKQELSAQLGVSQRTLERWVRLRLIPQPIKLGRKSLFHIPSLKKHLLSKA